VLGDACGGERPIVAGIGGGLGTPSERDRGEESG
jgi:hypothetical protein